MSLTTPIPDDLDAVLPGENWFYYWKTSSSLWRDKFAKFPRGQKVFLPLNWSLHFHGPGEYDFGKDRPEANLKKLITIAKEQGLKPILLLPTGPLPCLVNGGLPSSLATTLAKTDEHLPYVIVLPNGELVKIYSFYGP